jgi:HSP20 family protein
MNVRDLVPWGRQDRERALASTASESASPFLTLHREMNRLFDDVFRGFEAPALFGREAWPSLEVEDLDREYRVTAELPGLDERDIEVTMADGELCIRGEKRAETENRGRGFSERWYGRFERRLVLRDVDESRVQAKFHNGLLTLTLPKAEGAAGRVKRIPINGPRTAH